jgi:hypothetical protein
LSCAWSESSPALGWSRLPRLVGGVLSGGVLSCAWSAVGVPRLRGRRGGRHSAEVAPCGRAAFGLAVTGNRVSCLPADGVLGPPPSRAWHARRPTPSARGTPPPAQAPHGCRQNETVHLAWVSARRIHIARRADRGAGYRAERGSGGGRGHSTGTAGRARHLPEGTPHAHARASLRKLRARRKCPGLCPTAAESRGVAVPRSAVGVHGTLPQGTHRQSSVTAVGAREAPLRGA